MIFLSGQKREKTSWQPSAQEMLLSEPLPFMPQQGISLPAEKKQAHKIVSSRAAMPDFLFPGHLPHGA